MPRQPIDFTLNDVLFTCMVPPHWTLHEVLRDAGALPDVPDACTDGDCCRCTVLLNGHAVCACHILAPEAAGHAVYTRSGLADHPVVDELENLVSSCGSCIDAYALVAIDHVQAARRGDVPRLGDGLLSMPCTCHIEPQVRRVVQRLVRGRSQPAS